jgi:nucleoside-diphosphate-sugar epimerase
VQGLFSEPVVRDEGVILQRKGNRPWALPTGLVGAHGVEKSLFFSPACVYARNRQKDADVSPLKEEDAYPADPELGYGWEKLYTERLCTNYQQDYRFETCIVRSTTFTVHSGRRGMDARKPRRHLP